MNIQQFIESMGNKKEELLHKGIQCKSPAEILELAQKNSIDLDEEGAAEVFASISRLKTGKLSDEELDSVAGGQSYTKENNAKCNDCGCQFYTTYPYGCVAIPVCPNCGSQNLSLPDKPLDNPYRKPKE